MFSSFAATDHKGHFKKVLIRILKFGCFSWYYAYIFEKNKLNFPMQNAESIGTDSDKNIFFLLINLVPRVPSFYIRTKLS